MTDNKELKRNTTAVIFSGWMKNALLLFSFFLLFTEKTEAQYPAEKVPDLEELFPVAKVACGPWIQAVGQNEFTVVWTTNVDAIVWVEVAPDDGTHFYAKERPKYYHSLYGRRVTGKLHRVPVTGLQKGTCYRYRIFQQALLLDKGNKRVVLGDPNGSDILKQLPYKVTTLNPDKNEIRFVMVNDIHANDSVFRQLTKNVHEDNTDFVVFNGDMLTQIESEQQIMDGYLNSACELFASEIPFYALRGNHENRGSFSYEFFNYFPAPGGNAYYAFRHGPAYFIFLDSGEDKPDSDVRFYGLSISDQFREEEAKWLEQVIESSEFKMSPVKIVFMHMPPTERGWHGTLEVERLFMPVLNKANIDLMLSGHIHKHSYIEKGEVNNNFPILINSNLWKTEVSVSSGSLKMQLIDASGKIRKEYSM